MASRSAIVTRVLSSSWINFPPKRFGLLKGETMSIFETNPRTLKLLLTQIQGGELALPDFQRDFVWDPHAIEELIESIMKNYPAGSLLLLKHGGDGFQIREFEGAPALKSSMGTSYLVLDGQQRLTSLYQAFYGCGEHRFYLNIKELIDGGDIEAAVWHESEKKAERRGLEKIENQAEKLSCPLKFVMGEGFDSWIDSVMELRPEKDEAARELRGQLRQVNKEWIQPILDYQFPVVTLGEKTPLDAVCTMFETLNRRGVKLTVFELLMARSFANNVSLRQLWEEAVSQNGVLSQFEADPYYVLQVISLLSGKGIKRSEILNLEPKIIQDRWSLATTAMVESIEFLRKNCGILSPGLLPYQTMVVPLAAVWAKTCDVKGPQEASRREKFEQWFWASVFSQVYENGPTSRAVSDYKELEAWIRGGEKEPYALRALYFNPEMFLEISPKQRALYRGTIALVTTNGALDFHKAERLSFDYLEKNKVDDHHIFPQNYLKKHDDPSKVNCVLNRTLIDKKTNIRISDKAPSIYLEEIEAEVGEQNLHRILESHLIPIESLESDDFDGFLKARARILMEQLRERMKRDIPLAPTMLVAEDDEFEEEDESVNPRDKFDPAIINAHPTYLLSGMPTHVEQLFLNMSKALLSKVPDVWWKSNSRKVVFWSPEKVFFSGRISKTGLHLVAFTDGKPLKGVEQIEQKDLGGALWGRIKLKDVKDLDAVVSALSESHSRIRAAVAEGRATSWWAMTRKGKVA